MDTLEELRGSLDNLDDALVAILAERFKVTHRVGVHKAKHGLPSVDGNREKTQIERITALAASHGLDPDVAVKVLRLIIDETVKNHERIRAAAE